MKSPITVDYEKKKIVMTRAFAEKAKDIDSEEYRRLQEIRAAHHEWDVVTRKIKRIPRRKHTKGSLTNT